MSKITKDNCSQLAFNIQADERYGEFDSYFLVIYNYLRENGMELDNSATGLENVISFLETKINKS